MRLGLRCFGQTLNVRTTDPQVFTYVSTLDRLFSLPVTTTEFTESEPCLEIVGGTPPRVTYEPLSRCLTLQVEWALIDGSDAVSSLLAQLLCLACIDAGVFVFHAAAVCHDDRAYLLVGGLGAGKTSLSIALCGSSKFKWISNDHVALSMCDGRIVLCQGHDLIDFREMSFSQDMGSLPRDIVERIRSRFPPSTTPWTKTTPPFHAGELALQQAGLPCTVGALFFPVVGLTAYNSFQEMPRKQSTTMLLQMVTWPLQGVETFVLDNSGEALCPSVAIQPSRGWSEAYGFVNSVASLCPTYTVHGTLEYAIDWIDETISGS